MDTMQGHSGEHSCGECHGHGMVGDMCGHRHWRHIIIKILVALFIFWCGVQFGELKAMVRSYFGGYGMMGWPEQQMYYRSPMMYSVFGAAASPAAKGVVATTTTR